MSQKVKIGIDFGTLYARVAILENNNVTIIANSDQELKTPCFVSFVSDELLIGEAARDQTDLNSVNTIYNIKQLIGLKYDELPKDVFKYPFKFVKSETNNRAKIQVSYKRSSIEFYMEEIYAMILKKLVDDVEEYTKRKVESAVIAIPSHYTNIQRNCVLEAATIANLNVAQLLHETTASAVALATKNRFENKNILIIDFGAGKLDVSLVQIIYQNVKVLVYDGDQSLGGDAFTNGLVDYCVDYYKNEHKKHISDINLARSLLFKACDVAKCELSYKSNTKIQVDGILQNKTFVVPMDREKFASHNSSLFEQLEHVLTRFNKSIKNSPYEIDEIFLTGGSSRLFFVKDLIKGVFKKDFITGFQINSDESAVNGAAMCTKDKSDSNNPLKIYDIITYDLSLSTENNTQTNLIMRKFSKLKHLETKTIEIFDRGQIYVYESDLCIGTFELKHVGEVSFGFHYNKNGILSVTYFNQPADLTYITDHLSQDEINKLRCDFIKLNESNKIDQNLLTKRNYIEQFFINVLELLNEPILQKISGLDRDAEKEYYMNQKQVICNQTSEKDLNSIEKASKERMSTLAIFLYKNFFKKLSPASQTFVSDTFHSEKKARAVAIDVGSSRSRIATFINKLPELIQNNIDKYETPNYLLIKDKNEMFYGEAAFNLDFNGEIIYGLKRKLLASGNNHKWSQYLEFILMDLVRYARNYLELPTNLMNETKFVVTIPYEPRPYKEILQQIIKKMQIPCEFLVETDAIAMYCAFMRRDMDKQTVLIIDIGECKCDMAIYCINNMEVKTLFRKTMKFGGEDLTSVLIEYYKTQIDTDVLQELESQEGQKQLFRLRNACENAKLILSSNEQARIVVNNLSRKFDFKTTISRDKFESLCANLFNHFSHELKEMLDKKTINKIALSGGSAEIPKLRKIIDVHRRYETEIIKINQSAVVEGAAIYAAHLNGDNPELLKKLIVK